MSEGENQPQGAAFWQQHRVLRRLFLRLFLRGRPKSRDGRERRSMVWRMAGLLALYAIIGGVGLATFRFDVFERGATLHAFTLLMVGMMLASSSGTLLFNADEADILLHRPVTPRALLMAKVWVLFTLGLSLSLALNLVGLYLGVFGRHGTWLFFPAHVLALALEVIFAASVVTLAYGLCLRWFGREKLDNFITLAQVIVAVGAMAGGHVATQLINHLHGKLLDAIWPWGAVLPPAWFGALVAVLTGDDTSPLMLGLSAIGVAATALTAWLAMGRLAAAYGDGLLALNETAVQPAEARARGKAMERLLSLAVIRAWLRDPVERASFLLTASGLLRARDVKLRIYPQLAQLCVYPLIFMATGTGAPRAMASVNYAAFGLAFAGAMASTMIFNTLEMLRFSDHWRGAEMFRLAPLASPAPLFHGARKAVLLLLCGPLAVMLSVLALLWRGLEGGLLLLLPGFLAMPFFAMLPGLWHTLVPFSEPPEQAKNLSSGCVRTLLVMVSAAAIAFVTYWADRQGWLAPLLVVEIGFVFLATSALRAWIDRKPWHWED